MAAAPSAGGFRQPEDHEQRARLDDGGADVRMGVLGLLLMRHMSGARPQGWSDERLADQIHQPVGDLERAQRVLDEVAEAVGRPATPEPHWVESVRKRSAVVLHNVSEGGGHRLTRVLTR